MGEIVDCLNTQPVTILRQLISGGYTPGGLWVSGAQQIEYPNITADVQAASGKQLSFVPEGERTRDHVIAFITLPTLDVVNEPNQTQPDYLVYRGLRWKAVHVVEDWRENGFGEYLFQSTKESYAGLFPIESLAFDTGIVTAVLAQNHNFTTGSLVSVRKAPEAEYNVEKEAITVIDPFTFSYPIAGVPASSPVIGGYVALNQL